jgi:hypothetical protein
VRYSEKEAFNSCPYKYKLQQEGLVKQVEGSDAHDKNWGAAIHAGLMFHYQGKSWEEIEAAFRVEYPENLVEEDLAKTVESGLGTIKKYREFYANQDKNWEVLGTEEEGTVSIGGEDHDLHIDLVARNRQSGDIYLWDHKTTAKSASPQYWKGFELSGQLTRYCVYVKEKYGNCAGAIINNISVKFLKIKNKYGEGPGLVVNFERQLFNRSPQQIAFWRESDEDWMRQIKFSKENNCWPRALGKLCGWCEYYELCLASADEQIKELLYQFKEKV